MSIQTHDIQLLATVLDIPAAIQKATCPNAGGIDVFIGITRAESHPTAGNLLHLDYHAYDEMALAEMQKLADRAAEQWPITCLVLWHRIGIVPVGQASVVIVVACPHRQAAFAACRFLIDTLKEKVPIWKQEVFAHAAHWQGEH